MDRLIALVGLRFRIEARSTLGSRGRALGLLVALPFLALFSAAASLGAFALVRLVSSTDPGLLLPALSAIFTFLGVSFVLAPLLAGVSATESHDLSRLVAYPVPLATLVASSLVANLVQPMVLAQLPPLVALALAVGGPRWPLSFVGLGLGLLMTIAAAQTVGIALHALSRRRRLHDRLLFLGIGVSLLLSLLPVLVLSRGGSAARRALWALLERDVFALSPFAWGARAAVHAGRGELLPLVGFGAAALVAAALALGLSTVIAGRLYRGELDSGEAKARAARARIRLPGTLGAVIEKDLRVAWRDPRMKAVTLSGVVGPLVLLLILGQGSPEGIGPAQLFIVAGVAGVGVVGSNALALERDGLGLLLGFPVDRLALLAGKSIATLVLRAPALAAIAIASLMLAGPLLALAIAAVVLVTQVIGCAVDNYLQVLFPIPVPAAGRDPNAPISGTRGLGAAVMMLLAMAVTLLATAPFAFLAWLPQPLGLPWLFGVTLPLALAGACAVYFMAASGASRLLLRREPELLARLRGEG